MGTLDILIIIPLLFGAYRGFSKGLLVEIVGLIAFVLAILVGIKFLPLGIGFLVEHFGQLSTFIPYAAFILLFIGTLLLINLLGKLLKKILDMTLLGKVDNLVGALVGILKWAFLLSLLLWLSASVGIHVPLDLREDTMIYPVIEGFAPMAVDRLGNFVPFIEGLIETVNEMFEGER